MQPINILTNLSQTTLNAIFKTKFYYQLLATSTIDINKISTGQATDIQNNHEILLTYLMITICTTNRIADITISNQILLQ